MSLDSLPTETILNIASFLPPFLSSLSALTQTSKRLYSILERTLYTEDVQHHGSSSVYWAASRGNLAVLRKAIILGKAHIPTRGDYVSVCDDGSGRRLGHIPQNSRGVFYGKLAPHAHWDIDRDHPICLATRNGHEHLVKFLLDEVGCSPHIRDRQDFCLLSLAIMGGLSEEMIGTFLCLGLHHYVRSINGYYPLQIAVSKGDRNVVELLLASTPPDYVEEQIQHSFQSALLAKQIPVALLLLDHGGVNLNCSLTRWTEDQNAYMTTPLGWAVFHEDLDLAKVLLDKGADVDFTIERQLAVPRRVLFDVVERSQVEMVEFLLKRTTNRVACTKALSLAVEYASSSNDPNSAKNKVVKILLENGVSCNFEEDDIRPPPPIPQPRGPGVIVCQYPIQRRQNGEFIPPIVHAVHAGDLRLVQILLSYGADVNTSYRQLQIIGSKFCCGRILDLAKDLGHQQIADLLLKCGAQPNLGRPPYKHSMTCSVDDSEANDIFRDREHSIEVVEVKFEGKRTFGLGHSSTTSINTFTYSIVANSTQTTVNPAKINSKMPTPESAAFLAKKPTVPPTYEGVDFDDNVAIHNARDAIIREQWVRSMMARLVGEELGKCYAREGVNHFEKCGKLRERYLELLKDRKIKGYLFEEKNYFSKSS
ncbi:hypothetical protein ZTR_00506 [Talaromyces verruculosus]|nr:hypothetical protein ZTR_00506 [Talaromyces verruculosus]